MSIVVLKKKIYKFVCIADTISIIYMPTIVWFAYSKSIYFIFFVLILVKSDDQDEDIVIVNVVFLGLKKKMMKNEPSNAMLDLKFGTRFVKQNYESY